MPWIKIESPVYWAVFVSTFLGVAIWESFQPRRVLSSPAERRWGIHGLLLVLSSILQAAVLRLSPVMVAATVESRRSGILNKEWLPFALRFLAAVIVLDLIRYLTHRAFHRFSILWRVHEVH